MELILKKEIYLTALKEYQNIIKLLDIWGKNGWINDKQKKEVEDLTQLLNYKHHREADFNDRLIQLSTQNNVKHSIDRHALGGECFGFKQKDFDIYVESLEYGLIILVPENKINQNNISDLLDMVKWIDFAISQPDKAKIQLSYENLNNKLDKSIEVKKITKI